MATKTTALLLILFAIAGCSSGDIVVVPKNYTGYVLIIYGQKDGLPPKCMNGKRVYEIPTSGILKTQDLLSTDWTEIPQFYYEEVKPTNRIPFELVCSKTPFNSVVACGGSSGSANKDLEGKQRVSFTHYCIGNKVQIDSAFEQVERLDKASLGE